MPCQGSFRLTTGNIPQPNRIVPTPAGQGGAIRGERYRKDIPRVPREQGHFGASVGIVKPDTDAACHRQARAVRRIGYRSVIKTDFTVAQAGESAFRKG